MTKLIDFPPSFYLTFFIFRTLELQNAKLWNLALAFNSFFLLVHPFNVGVAIVLPTAHFFFWGTDALWWTEKVGCLYFSPSFNQLPLFTYWHEELPHSSPCYIWIKSDYIFSLPWSAIIPHVPAEDKNSYTFLLKHFLKTLPCFLFALIILYTIRHQKLLMLNFSLLQTRNPNYF